MSDQFPHDEHFPRTPPTASSARGARRWFWLVPAGAVVVAIALVGAFLAFRSGPAPEPVAIGESGSAAPVSPTTVTETVTSTARASPAPADARDLGLSRPLVVPRCTGQTVVFLESISVTAPDLREQVRKWVEPWEFGPLGAVDYLHSQAACSSIRSVDDNGQPFYAVFAAPAGDVCARFNAVRGSLPPGAYPRLLSDSVAPGYNPCSG
ncbi:putative serine/threonine protein kinase [Gordonia araii NBRC 100433]|uniref:Putative serine/threonine protein kinase n=1 Tax=Gordonia araii NBRC 100433 TaxID=1073574 RepID=G7GYR6_9ACTN|nr:hypothetical protein [Gordonia araii]NNG98958.1 hypothetical protein [Gordonia araii NBRC 100433]GAB08741.1 putative serine/threonine protein kinase [Gordonia araii NBRC 100433]